MNLLRNIKFFNITFILFLSSNAFAVPEEISNPPTHDFDYVSGMDSSFYNDGVIIKGDFIQTTSGQVPTQRVGGILLWEDIPFALPPLKDLRWKAPRENVNPSLKIIPKENNFCHQEVGGEIQEIYETGSEDCLYLDVRAPHIARDNMPVMFWIHGGGNTSGHKDFYDFSELVKRKDVIVVSINYRLGPLGFFTHPAIQDLNSGLDKTSNFGILDIILALKWVKENINSFGGDPNNITIFGESAGGHNVLSLLVAPQARGLFHKAISQSGYTKSSSLENAYKSEHFNQDKTSDSWTVFNKYVVQNGLIEDIQKASIFQSNASKKEIRKILYNADPQTLVNMYGDTFETPLLTNDGVVIPRMGLLEALGSPEHLYKVPTIAGSNKDEIKLWIGFSKYFIEADRFFLSRTLGVPKLKIKDINKYEFYNSVRASGWQLRGVQEPLNNIFNAGNKEVYAYRFDWDNLRDFFIGDFSEIIGAAHAIEIPMVSGDFDLVGEFQWIVYPRSKSRRYVSRNMMNFWTNFAKFGTPGASSNKIYWESYNPNSSNKILIIDEKKNLRISSLDLSLDGLVNEISASNLLDDEEKCILLYETSNYIGDNSFNDYKDLMSFNCSREEALRISERNSGSIEL